MRFAEMTPDEVQLANELAAGYKRSMGFGLILLPHLWAEAKKAGLDMSNLVEAKPLPITSVNTRRRG